MALFDVSEQHLPCLAHSINLGVVSFVETVTQTGLLESQDAIWQYDPANAENLRGGKLDGIAIVRTLVVKVQSSDQRADYLNQCQKLSGAATAIKIPLHGNTRWGTAALMCRKAHNTRKAIDMFVDHADDRFGPITTIRKPRTPVKKIPWKAFRLYPDDWARIDDCAKILEVSIAIY